MENTVNQSYNDKLYDVVYQNPHYLELKLKYNQHLINRPDPMTPAQEFLYYISIDPESSQEVVDEYVKNAVLDAAFLNEEILGVKVSRKGTIDSLTLTILIFCIFTIFVIYGIIYWCF